MKMLRAGGHVPTHTLAPASASALAIAKPKPASSATPATNARRPSRSIGSMAGSLARLGSRFTVSEGALIEMPVRLRCREWNSLDNMRRLLPDQLEGGAD